MAAGSRERLNVNARSPFAFPFAFRTAKFQLNAAVNGRERRQGLVVLAAVLQSETQTQ